MNNIINEHWRKADESIEHVELSSGNPITVFIKDGEAIIFPSLWDMCLYKMGGKQVSRAYTLEDNLGDLYEKHNDWESLIADEDVDYVYEAPDEEGMDRVYLGKGPKFRLSDGSEHMTTLYDEDKKAYYFLATAGTTVPVGLAWEGTPPTFKSE